MNALIARALRERRDLGYITNETRSDLRAACISSAAFEATVSYLENCND